MSWQRNTLQAGDYHNQVAKTKQDQSKSLGHSFNPLPADHDNSWF